MTPEEKGALLLAHHEGKVIEIYSILDPRKGWIEATGVMEKSHWIDGRAYRVRPEPKRETVTLYWKKRQGAFASLSVGNSTHKITFDLIDGQPDLSSVRMEPVT